MYKDKLLKTPKVSIAIPTHKEKSCVQLICVVGQVYSPKEVIMGKMKDKQIELVEEAYWLGVSDRKQGLPHMRLVGHTVNKEIQESYDLGYEEGLNNE